MEGTCYCYRKRGHKYLDCITKEKIQKYEWAINKAQQYIYSKNDDDKRTLRNKLSS